MYTSGSYGKSFEKTIYRRSSFQATPIDDNCNQDVILHEDKKNCITALRRWRRRVWRNVLGVHEDQTLDDCDAGFVRHRPETLKELCRTTKFSKKEIQLMYRGFKQCCPTGLVTLEQFKDIYSQFFPQGDSTKYAGFIFGSFDRDKNGQISFDEFVMGLSVLSRGTEEDKLRWVFDLYDVNRDGLLTRDDIETVIISVYDMMGPNTDPPINEQAISDHVDIIFRRMDENGDGSITLPEFMEGCRTDESIRQSLHLFDTIFSSGPSGTT